MDPLDEGNLPKRLLPLSRMLARVLRHSAPNAGLSIDMDGWCSRAEVLRLQELSGWQVADVETVVRESFSKSRPRFEMQMGSDGEWQIRATHKHSCINERGRRGPAQAPVGAPAERSRARGAAQAEDPMVQRQSGAQTGHAAVPRTSQPAAAAKAGAPCAQRPAQALAERPGAGGAARGEDPMMKDDPWAQSGSRASQPPAAAKAGQLFAQRPSSPAGPKPPPILPDKRAGPKPPPPVCPSAGKRPPPAPPEACGPQPAPAHAAAEQPAAAEKLAATEAAVAAEAPGPSESSLGRFWDQYQLPGGEGLWWSCGDDWFLEDSPGSWQKFKDPNTAKLFWHHETSAEWFFGP